MGKIRRSGPREKKTGRKRKKRRERNRVGVGITVRGAGD